MFKLTRHVTVLLLLSVLFACSKTDDPMATQTALPVELTTEDAVEFVVQSEVQLADLLTENERMAWVYSNFITEDTEMLSALASKKFTAAQVELAVEAARYYEIEGLDGGWRMGIFSWPVFGARAVSSC